MAGLRQVFGDLCHADVTTYVQSGNVVFRSPQKPKPLISALEARIAKDLKVNVTVLVRTRDELGTIVENNPFVGRVPDETKLHVTFLTDRPTAGSVADDFGQPDEFHIQGREVYLHCPGGYGTTKLNNALWERKLGTPATTRNWKTVNKLLEMAGAIA